MIRPCVAQSVVSWLSLTMTWVYNQLKFADSFSHIVLALETQNLDQFPWDPIYVPGKLDQLLVKVGRKLDLNVYPQAYRAGIARHQPVILHSHFADQGWRDLPLARAYQLKHVVTFYGYDVNMLPVSHPAWLKRYSTLFSRADLFLCEGSFMANCVINLGCPADKVYVHHLGIDTEKIPYISRKLGKDEPLKILIAGSFREKKGIPYALEALGKFGKKYPNMQITIIGNSTGHNNAEKEKIHRVIQTHNLESKVRMLGFQPHSVMMSEAYVHHIFLSPSVTAANGDTEGGAPVSIIEMAASGMPVVSSRHCDIPEVIPEDICGLLADERDVDGLARHLEWLVENSDKWKALTGRGRRHIEEKYNAKLQGKSLGKIYESLLTIE
jgi:colanic acid/amylovoran biosynthesis glycosyltransferase